MFAKFLNSSWSDDLPGMFYPLVDMCTLSQRTVNRNWGWANSQWFACAPVMCVHRSSWEWSASMRKLYGQLNVFCVGIHSHWGHGLALDFNRRRGDRIKTNVIREQCLRIGLLQGIHPSRSLSIEQTKCEELKSGVPIDSAIWFWFNWLRFALPLDNYQLIRISILS